MIEIGIIEVLIILHSLGAILITTIALVFPIGLILNRKSQFYPSFIIILQKFHYLSLIIAILTILVGLIKITSFYDWKNYVILLIFQLKLVLIILAMTTGLILMVILLKFKKALNNIQGNDNQLYFVQNSDLTIIVISFIYALLWIIILIIGFLFYFNII